MQNPPQSPFVKGGNLEKLPFVVKSDRLLAIILCPQ